MADLRAAFNKARSWLTVLDSEGLIPGVLGHELSKWLADNPAVLLHPDQNDAAVLHHIITVYRDKYGLPYAAQIVDALKELQERRETTAPQANERRLELFVNALIDSLKRRYGVCEDHAATPSTILLAVLNAVEDARQAGGRHMSSALQCVYRAGCPNPRLCEELTACQQLRSPQGETSHTEATSKPEHSSRGMSGESPALLTSNLETELLDEAYKFLTGIAASPGEFGFARSRKASDWLGNYERWKNRPVPETPAPQGYDWHSDARTIDLKRALEDARSGPKTPGDSGG